MSERYSRLFSLPQNLYTEDAPVLVAAGALLKDNQTGKVLAQLKIQSITEKTIKAAKVQITPFDTVGNPLDGTTEKEFLDLSICRDDTFGQKTPVFLPNASTRGFAVRVTEIAFADNVVWQDNGCEWKPLTVQSKLIDKLKDPELVKQYQLSFGAASQFIPAKERDLWICSCGHINHAGEEACTVCGVALQALRNVDFKALQAEKQARLVEEAKQAQEEEKKANATKKKAIITAAIAIPLAIMLIVFGVWFTKYSKTKVYYNEALSLAESGYEEQAIEMLESIEDFKDSSKQIKQIRYQLANTLYQKKEYDKAIELFESLADYEDSVQMVKYVNAEKLLFEQKYQEAIPAYKELGDFKESTDRVNSIYSAAKSLLGKNDEAAYGIFVTLGDYEQAKEYADDFSYLPIVSQEEVLDFSYRCQYNRKGQIIKKTNNTTNKNTSLGITYLDLTFSYNKNNLLSNITEYSQSDGSKQYITTFDYDSNGNCVKKETKGMFSSSNDRTTTFFYDNNNRCIKKVSRQPGTEVSETFEYTYNKNNQCIQEKHSQTSVSGYAFNISTHSFEYDKNGNIKTEKVVADESAITNKDLFETATYTYHYDYDEAGNVTRIAKINTSNGQKYILEQYEYGHVYTPDAK